MAGAWTVFKDSLVDLGLFIDDNNVKSFLNQSSNSRFDHDKS